MDGPRKIAVVVESLYIPAEIRAYQQRFSAAGYQVELVARLYGSDAITVYSDNVSDIPFVGRENLEELRVTVDVDTARANLRDYAAVIAAANYTSVRSRYFTPADGGPRNAPAVRLFAEAMRDPGIVKGALCHGLWLLTPHPELLAGRRVICHEVVRADVLNAGAVIDTSALVVVDGDLITGHSGADAAGLADRVLAVIAKQESGTDQRTRDLSDHIADALAARLEQVPSNAGERPVAAAARAILEDTLDVAAEVRRLIGVMVRQSEAPRRILLLASRFGAWASELTLVAGTLRKAGYDVQLGTEDGSPPHLLSPSLDPAFRDGAWRGSVVSADERELAERFLRPGTDENRLLTSGIFDLSALARPPQVGDALRDRSLLARYRQKLRATVAQAANYDGIVIAGGSGAIPGFMADRGLHSLILAFHEAGKPVMGQCNGGLAVAQTIDPRTGLSILFGRAVTTHSWLDEYQSGWGWTALSNTDLGRFWKIGALDLAAYQQAEQWVTPGLQGNPLIDSESLFKNAAGPQGLFFSPPGTPYSVVVDGNVITCRTTPDGYPGALALIARLDGDPPLSGRLFIDGDKVGRRQPAK